VLFEPMARGATSSDGSRSVGLGLYIVREIAKAHGGTVTVASNAEEGTTFTATFRRDRIRHDANDP
jgi:phosphoserine phosphatase RsbU/P